MRNRKNGKIKANTKRLKKTKNRVIVDIAMIIQVGEKDRLISEIHITIIQINEILQVDKSIEVINDVTQGVEVVIRIEESPVDHLLNIDNNKELVIKNKLKEVDLSLPFETMRETTTPKAITNQEDRMIIMIAIIISRMNLKETTTIIVTEIFQTRRND